jgi:3-methylcrotonyl-CoA carboxylase alpha subunit
MFESLLIANRGEIACRIIRTARRMGIRTIAVFSEADAGAQHVLAADEAYPIGPAPAAESYLRADVILDVARRAGAGAVHPGYGFLSENAAFAEACAAAGIAFIGPTADAIRVMGSKAESKRLMVAAGVPTVPGYHGEAQDEALLATEAARIGFPVLIKASAGGGGKGMRPVLRAEDFAAELAGARREALAAFGDERVLLEKYLGRPRHVEVQVLGDHHGRIIHLHTRDCSVQRRHQKVLEEAPAPDLSDALRERLHQAAIGAAAAVGYRNAGTVEFIVEGEAAYFLEMNTRLQVEHPVTEMVTGLDLVEWQLRVAAGEALPEAFPPATHGHAVEVRLYAEDAAQDFRPSTGRLSRFSMPGGVRVDAGFAAGDLVSAFYDPMLAKMIAWGEDRDAALLRLAEALEAAELEGLASNLPFLRRLVRHPALRDMELDTGFIPRHAGALLAPRGAMPESLLAAALAWQARQPGPPPGPWQRGDGWRLQGEAAQDELWSDGVALHRLRIRRGPSGVRLDATASAAGARFAADGEAVLVRRAGEAWRLVREDAHAPKAEAQADAGRLAAPIPGRLVQLLVAVGDVVAQGQLLAVMEAMKTELKFAAPFAGRVVQVPHAVGESIEEGRPLIVLVAEG